MYIIKYKRYYLKNYTIFSTNFKLLCFFYKLDILNLCNLFVNLNNKALTLLNIRLSLNLFSNTYISLCYNFYILYMTFYFFIKKFNLNILCLPFKKKLYTLVRSPFIFKKSKEHYILEKRRFNLVFNFILKNYLFSVFIKKILFSNLFKNTLFCKNIYLTLN